jgi:hypothetical protein
MVHALDEIRHVLVRTGSLIDLRPLLDRWPVEVASKNANREAGRVTDLAGPLADDGAANQALAEAELRGWFLREHEDVFPFFYYWDTPKEMQEYIDETWDDVISINDDLWNDLRSLWATANADARVRIRVKMKITGYTLKIPFGETGES